MILGELFISGPHSAQYFNFLGINVPQKDKLNISDWIAGHQEPFGLLMKLPRG